MSIFRCLRIIAVSLALGVGALSPSLARASMEDAAELRAIREQAAFDSAIARVTTAFARRGVRFESAAVNRSLMQASKWARDHKLAPTGFSIALGGHAIAGIGRNASIEFVFLTHDFGDAEILSAGVFGVTGWNVGPGLGAELSATLNVIYGLHSLEGYAGYFVGFDAGIAAKLGLSAGFDVGASGLDVRRLIDAAIKPAPEGLRALEALVLQDRVLCVGIAGSLGLALKVTGSVTNYTEIDRATLRAADVQGVLLPLISRYAPGLR